MCYININILEDLLLRYKYLTLPDQVARVLTFAVEVATSCVGSPCAPEVETRLIVVDAAACSIVPFLSTPVTGRTAGVVVCDS